MGMKVWLLQEVKKKSLVAARRKEYEWNGRQTVSLKIERRQQQQQQQQHEQKEVKETQETKRR